MSARLRAYVALVSSAGVGLLLVVTARAELPPSEVSGLTVAVLAVLVAFGEAVMVPIRHGGQTKEINLTSPFALTLTVLAGLPVGLLVLAVASAAADAARRKPLVKVLFNLSQWVLALGAGGAVYTALGGSPRITAATVPAMLAGGVVFLLVNHALVVVVISLADGTPLRTGLVEDLRVELGSSVMLLALAPVAVATALQSALLVPALLLPVAAVHLAAKREVEADHRRAEAEAAAERQRRLTEQEQEVVRRLQDADRLKQDLIATVSHELRNPLTTILGIYAILDSRGERLAPTARHDLIAMGIRQSDRLKRMIEQLLLAAKFQDGVTPLPLPQDDLDAAELLRQAAAEGQTRHGDRAIEIQAVEALPVRVAHDAVAQVLGNLIDNACKYAADAGPVRVVASRNGAVAVLAVEDCGPGIPSADRQRIFERFSQLDAGAARRAGGVGLGLYIARQLARSQAGDLVVTDASGPHGARFELRLPLLAEAAGG
jgi:signal transduction histidine kinase